MSENSVQSERLIGVEVSSSGLRAVCSGPGGEIAGVRTAARIRRNGLCIEKPPSIRKPRSAAVRAIAWNLSLRGARD